MKKTISLLLTIVLSLCMLAGCQSSPIEDNGSETLTPLVDLIGLDETQGTAMYAEDVYTDYDGTFTTPETSLESGYTMHADEEELDDDAVSETKPIEGTGPNGSVKADGTGVGSSAVSVTERTTVTTEATYVSNPIKIPDVSDRISVNSVGKQFWYTQLTEKEQRTYDAIVAAITKFEAVVNFTDTLTAVEYEKIFGIVYYQNPELFWISDAIVLNDGGKSASLYYTYTKSQAADIQQFLDSKVTALAKTIPATATELKKLQICHDYVCTHTEFSMDYPTGESVIGCMVDGVAQCTGYAKTMLYLCNVIDVPCMFIVGRNSEGATHAWNYVQLKGDWYLLDATWDDPIMKVPNAQNVYYQYFCVRDIETRDITHFDINIAVSNSKCLYFEVPKCTSDAQNIDKVYGNYAKTYEEGYEMLKADLFKAVETGGTTAHVKFATQEVYLDARKRLYTDKELLNIKHEIETSYGAGCIKNISVNGQNSQNYLAVILTY